MPLMNSSQINDSQRSWQRKAKPWISPLLLNCTGQTWQSCSRNLSSVVGPGSYSVDLRKSIGANPNAGFSFTKTKSDRLDTSLNRKYLVHGGQTCLAINGADIHAYTSASYASVASDGQRPWSGKGQINKYPSMPHAVFGFSPRFRDSIRSYGILDGRRCIQKAFLMDNRSSRPMTS